MGRTNSGALRAVRHVTALVVLFFISASAFVQKAAAQTDGPLRVAIVGLAHGHVEGFLNQLPKHPDVQLVGIAEPDPVLQAKYRDKYALPEELFFRDMARMLEDRRPQAVLVYTSIADHRRVIETAASYGVAVMVEKPLTISLEDALAIRKTAREHHIHVLVNYETTWYASNKAARDEVEAGRIGAIRRIVVHDGHQGPREITYRRSSSIGSPILRRMAPAHSMILAAMARTLPPG